ncbi:hypothetical protein E4U16_007519, partial [Claviceps sp. LM84 group G4]
CSTDLRRLRTSDDALGFRPEPSLDRFDESYARPQMRGRFPDQDEDVVALTAAPEIVSIEQWLVWICGRANAEQNDCVIIRATVFALSGHL